MNLVVTVGNTNAKAALFSGKVLKKLSRFRTSDLARSLEALEALLPVADAVALVSVVPAVTERVGALSDKVRVLTGDNAGLDVHYEPPGSLGADRVALALYALARFPDKPVLAVDAGTCITVDAAGPAREFHGGVILPGLETSLAALAEAAQLPALEQTEPTPGVPRTTTAAMSTGVSLAVISGVHAAASFVALSMGWKEHAAVLTGGLAEQLSHLFPRAEREEHAVLMGGLEWLLTSGGT